MCTVRIRRQRADARGRRLHEARPREQVADGQRRASSDAGGEEAPEGEQPRRDLGARRRICGARNNTAVPRQAIRLTTLAMPWPVVQGANVVMLSACEPVG